uniref:Vacuolar protein 8 n=1 Tax=Globisporangium ultimum (strain ATCC 200006 / CBS 805.95 / DAOM BR144) TaxID=431595 RepID=K3WT16_GLOUD
MTQNTNLLTKEMKLKCVEGLYSISCHKGIEMQIINEGALATIISVLKMDDIAIRLFAAATLLNLTAAQPPTKAHKSSSGNLVALSLVGKEVYSKLIDEGVISALLELSHTPNATVKALCVRALFRFTVDESHHFRMVHEGSVVALTQLMTSIPSEDVKEACMNGLVNLASIPRAVACDSILNTLIALAKSGRPELLTVCGRVLLNLSILPTTRSSMVEEGAVVALSVLASQKQPVLFETISCVLCNLAAIKTNQELLMKNGGLAILMDLLDSVQMEFERVSEEDGNEDEDEDGDGDQQGSTSNPSVDSAREEAVTAATMLLARIRKNCINVLAHLCCNPKLQSRVVNAAFIPKILHILQEFSTHGRSHIDEDTEKYCIIAIANLSLDDRCRPNIVYDGGAPVLLSLLQNAERQDVNSMLLKLDCVTALSNLMLHPKNFKRMVDEGIVPAFIESINNSASPEIQKACVYAMLNLAKDPGMKTRLAEATAEKDQGAIPTMLVFASKHYKNAELCGVCISFLHHLSTQRENYDVLYFEGAVGLLVRVLQKPSNSEPVPVIYSLWLTCMVTLANLASHTTKRASLIGDGVIEAIQHFLSVSASDSRRRDVSTDTKIVKTQFAASQILFKLHELCCSTKEEIPAFFASLLLLATQSALKNSRLEKKAVTVQQMTASRCALTISKVSLMPRGLRLLSGNADIPPALNIIMRTGLHEAQVCAAIALCNLATERGHLKHRLWRDSTIEDFIVITLLRVNSEQTKAICAKALFNLLTHEDTRDQMVKDGVLYALIKLARIENEGIRDLSLRSIYNISLHPIKALQLLEMEIVRILAKMYQAEFSKEIKRLMCGILSNLSSVPDGHESRILQEGALSVLKNLAKVRDPETKVYAANILYNLSCCLDVAEALVRDEAGVLGILAAQLKSENKDVKRYGAASIANLSGNTLAVTLMTEDALIVILNDAMKKTMATGNSSNVMAFQPSLRF